MDKKEEKKSLENELSLREKIELRKEAYRLALHIQPLIVLNQRLNGLILNQGRFTIGY